MASLTSTRIFENRCRALMAAAKTSTAASATTKTSAADAAPPKTRGRPQGILKPQPVSPAFQQFVGMPEVSRSDAMKIVWDYIKEQKLQELEVKRKERAQVAYERKKKLIKLRVKAEKAGNFKLCCRVVSRGGNRVVYRVIEYRVFVFRVSKC